MMRVFCLSLIVTILTLLNTQAHATTEAECHMTVGVVPQFEQRRIFKVWNGLLEALSAETECQFTIQGSKSIQEFEKAFQSGAYDMAYMNPYHAVMAFEAQGYTPILRAGNKKLKGVLVVRKDSVITDVKELNGKKIAYPSPNALGASLLMRAELHQKHDVTTQEKYVKTHGSVYLSVAKGLVDAGGGVGRTLKEQPKYIQDALRVLYTTDEVNPHPIVLHPRVDNAQKQSFIQALLALYEKQPELFAGIPMQAAQETSFDDYEKLRSMNLEAFTKVLDN